MIQAANEIKTFEVGKTYSCRSICNYDSVWSITVAKRTDKTITTTSGKTLRINSKLSAAMGAESVFPTGRYSMAPMIKAG